MPRKSAFLLAIIFLATPVGANAKQLVALEVLQPKPNQILQGMVDVHVRYIDGQIPTVFRCGIGGGPWSELQQVVAKNEWVGKVDSTLVPNGLHNLLVLTDVKKSIVEVPVNIQNPLNVYFGDLHSHTRYSDGTLTPADAHRYARDVAKLDVFILADHLEKIDETEWLETRENVWDANEDGKFVAIAGLEWSKELGHACIFDPKTRHWPEDLKGFYEAVAKADVIVKFNHPDTGEKVFVGLAYSEKADKVIQLIEVRTSKEEVAYIRALNLGWHLAPDGSDDTHWPDWGNRTREWHRAWTGILATGLSKRNIWDALKNRRCYSTADRNCRFFFEVNGAAMGEIVEQPVQNVKVKVVVEDPNAEDKIAKIELFEDGIIVKTTEPQESNYQWTTTLLPAPGKHHYFVKVTQADGHRLWGAPVWVTVGEQAGNDISDNST